MRELWTKRGVLIAAPTPHAWSHTHAALPAPDLVDECTFDLYYSPRDSQGRAHIARTRIEADSAGTLRAVAEERSPVLSPGSLGAFDDSGVTVSCVVRSGRSRLLYYTGWVRGVTVPFYLQAGLAISHDGAPYERVSLAPMLERNGVDPYLTASPWVINDRGRWRMWYVSAVDWQATSEPCHRYHIRCAESDDGISWSRSGKVAIDFASDEEYAISRPCVIKDDDGYRMWFAARGDRYRLGYAESQDGYSWSRDDQLAGLEASSDGWDAKMVAYPAVLDLAGRRYLLYNGNDYGMTGIGYAVIAAES